MRWGSAYLKNKTWNFITRLCYTKQIYHITSIYEKLYTLLSTSSILQKIKTNIFIK